jgi:hypothetical protein
VEQLSSNLRSIIGEMGAGAKKRIEKITIFPKFDENNKTTDPTGINLKQKVIPHNQNIENKC